MQRKYCLAILIPLFIFSFSQLQATQWTVTISTNTGTGSLRQIIAASYSGDSIFFAVRGSIVVDSSLNVDKSLHFFGPGADSLQISGGDRVRIIRVDTAVIAQFERLTFSHGNAVNDTTDRFPDGGAIKNFGTCIFRHCLFTQNAAGYGGAISNSGGTGRNAELYLENCAFIENTATPPMPNPLFIFKSGGAINSDGFGGGRSKVVATNCTFSGNAASDRGGAIFHYQDATDTTRSMVLTHCTITNNQAAGAGGVDVSQFGLTSYTNTIVAGNIGRIDNPNIFGNLTSRGGLLVGKITFNSTIGKNIKPDDQVNVNAHLGPLGFYNSPIPSHSLQCLSPAIDKGIWTTIRKDQKGQSRIDSSDIGAFERNDPEDIRILNFQDKGAGAFRTAVINACDGDTLTMAHLIGEFWLDAEIEIDKNLTIWGNPDRVLWVRAMNKNRHLLIDTAQKVSIRNLSFAGGRPDQAGGGAILNKGELTIEACTFTDNKAISGGAIANYGEGKKARLIALNATFSHNVATLLDGGAIDNYAFTDSAFVLTNHCTFVYNEAVKRGGAFFSNEEAVYEIKNTILADNTARDGQEMYGNVTSLGHNLVKDISDGSFSPAGGDITGINPKIGGLMYHGGSSYTHALQAGSPAIDAGSTGMIAFDQRGFARVFGTQADIGSYEYDPATGLEEDEFETWKLYPNPAKDFVTLAWPKDLSGQRRVDISVYNLQNQLVMTVRGFSVTQETNLRLDLRELNSGLYFLHISGEGNEKIFKLILQ